MATLLVMDPLVALLGLALVGLALEVLALRRRVRALEEQADLSGRTHLLTALTCGVWFDIVQILAEREVARGRRARPRPQAEA